MKITKVQRKALKNFNLKLYYSFFETTLGEVIIALVDGKLVELNFVKDKKETISELKKKFQPIEILEDHTRTENIFREIFVQKKTAVEILLIGSEFQLKVWEAIHKLGKNKFTTYKDIAREIGNPKAIQAVGSAVGANPVAILIPCHNVIKSNGEIGEYRWGQEKKIQVIEWERSKK